MADPLSIIGAIAACQQIVSRLTKILRGLSVAEQERASMVLRLDHYAFLLRQFSELLVELTPEIDPDRRDHFYVIIEHMHIVLQNTIVKMEKWKNKKASNSLLWSIVGVDLKDAEKELFEWSQRLAISFAFMSMPIKTTFLDKFPNTLDGNGLPSWLAGLRANVRMETGKFDSVTMGVSDETSIASQDPAPWNSLSIDQVENLWFDHIDTTSASRRGVMVMDEVQLEVSRLFAVLRQADPMSNRILTAKHFLSTDDINSRFVIASNLPYDTSQRGRLSQMLWEPLGHVRHPLDHRIRIARELVTAVAYVHAMGWVHKAIRPTNVLMLHAHDDLPFPQGLGHAFLVGFEFARRGAARSTGSGHWGWREDVYRHPDRQNKDGVDLEIYFTTKHDIYSIGVVLLEIGAWTTLTESHRELKLADPDERRRLLLGCTERLADTMGSRYAALTKKCIAVDMSEIDVQQVLTELQELRI